MNKKNLIGNKRKLSSSSILQKTSSTKKRIKYIDISNGNENTKILLNSKDKSKMLKNFQFTTNYTTESIIINKYQKSYLNEGNIQYNNRKWL